MPWGYESGHLVSFFFRCFLLTFDEEEKEIAEVDRCSAGGIKENPVNKVSSLKASSFVASTLSAVEFKSSTSLHSYRIFKAQSQLRPRSERSVSRAVEKKMAHRSLGIIIYQLGGCVESST